VVLSLGFPHQNPICATCPAHRILLDSITRKILVKYRSLTSPLFGFLKSPITSTLLPNILLRTLFSNSLSLRYSRVSNQDSHPCKRQNYSTVRKLSEEVSSHFEYLENWSCGLHVTWQPVRRDLNVHP
jgi:hypothetical protein